MGSSRTVLIWPLTIAAGVLSLPAAASHAAGAGDRFSIVSQSRSLSVAADAQDLVNDDSNSKTITAPNAAAFNQNVGTSASAGDAVVGSQAQAIASQVSTLSPTAITASGSIYADSFFGTGLGADSSAQSLFDSTFTLSNPIQVTLLSHVLMTQDYANPDSYVATVSLDNSSGQSLTGPLDLTSFNTIGQTLALAPGTYQLAFNANVISDDESSNQLLYSVSLQPSIFAVPLPQAWVSGGSLLLAIGAASLLRRRPAVQWQRIRS